MSDLNTPNFQDMAIAKLREYASHLRVQVAKTATKEEIIKAIENKLNGRVIPTIASGDNSPLPGYARIRVLEDPTPGAMNIPVYINSNGYVATLPRGVDIDVPMRVLRCLNDAVVRRRKQTTVVDPNTGREVFKETTVVSPSYPFQVIEITPGPEVLTPHEMNKLKADGPRKRYRQMFGRYPRPADLHRAIERGLITIGAEESVAEAPESMITN